MAKYTYTVMGCSGAMPLKMASLKQAIKKARSCARSGKTPVNVNRHNDRASVISPGGYVTVYRCTKRGCGGYSPHHAGSYAAWERQAKADGYLKGGKRRRKAR